MADKKTNEAEEVVDTENTTDVEACVSVSEEKKSGKKNKEGAKKLSFFARIGSFFKRFWKTMKSELKKVTWFSRKQTYTSTLLVLVVMVISAIVIGALDLGFSKGLEALANNINILK